MKRLVAVLSIAALLLCGCSQDLHDEEAYNDTFVEGDDQEKTPSNPIDTTDDPVKKDPLPEQNEGDEEPQPPAQQPAADDEDPPSQEKKDPQKEEPKQEKEPAYTTMVCDTVSKWKVVQFETGHTAKLKFSLPTEWKLTKEDSNTYKVEKDGAAIGTLSTKDLTPADQEYEYSYHNNPDTEVTGFTQINQYGDQFQRVIQLSAETESDPLILNLQLQYTAIDEASVTTLMESAASIPMNMTTIFPKMSATNNSKTILIAGNSFVNTSMIGTILQNLLDSGKTGYKVHAISRGMAEVENYANDADYCNDIRSGKYCYVFQCGFYGGEENVIAFETIVDACKASNTKLVIFPAHNESASIINSAKSTYAGPIFLDWKTEITQLIDGGIDRWEFCINDAYKHSTPLAGYVGAHMIYRNLFREIPPSLTGNKGISMQEVLSVLKDYPTKAEEPEITSYSIQ